MVVCGTSFWALALFGLKQPMELFCASNSESVFGRYFWKHWGHSASSWYVRLWRMHTQFSTDWWKQKEETGRFIFISFLKQERRNVNRQYLIHPTCFGIFLVLFYVARWKPFTARLLHCLCIPSYLSRCKDRLSTVRVLLLFWGNMTKIIATSYKLHY